MMLASRRLVLVGMVALVPAIAAGWQPVADGLLNHTIRSSLLTLATRFQDQLLADGKLHVWFCGTGSPQAEHGRAQSCLAVLADDTFLVFDTGPGSGIRADLDNLPLSRLDAVFFTHLHSDHINDLPTFANHSWRYGRSRPLDVFGPAGTTAVVEGFNQAMAPDVAIRSRNEVKDASGAASVGHDIVVPGDGKRELVYESSTGVKVYAFLVHHEPAEPAFGYRVEHRGRVVVISGDTRKTEQIAQFGKDADLLVHEAYNKDLVNRVLGMEHEVPEAPGSRRAFEIARLTQAYHTSPIEAAELAAKARARILVLTHVIPPMGQGLKRWVLESFFLKGVSDAYRGDVLLAEDGMHLALPLAVPERSVEKGQ